MNGGYHTSSIHILGQKKVVLTNSFTGFHKRTESIFILILGCLKTLKRVNQDFKQPRGKILLRKVILFNNLIAIKVVAC